MKRRSTRRQPRRLRLALYRKCTLFSCTLFVLNIAKNLQSRHASKYFLERERCIQGESIWHTDWLSFRSTSFISLWRSHKTRNMVMYACISTRRIPIVNVVVYHAFTCPDVVYDERYELLFEVPRVCLSHKCLRWLGRSHFIYAEFVLKTFDIVISATISPPRPETEGKIAVLLEPRNHPMLEYTIKQVMLTLGTQWALQIFVSNENVNLIRERLRIYPNDVGQHIVLTRVETFGLEQMSSQGNRLQSAFSTHEGLYNAILSEHILWFQLDVVMRSSPRDE